MKLSALTLAKINRTLSALVLSASAVIAQTPDNNTGAAAAPAVPSTPPPAVPAAIEPPTVPGIPADTTKPAPGLPGTPGAPTPAGTPGVIEPPGANPGAGVAAAPTVTAGNVIEFQGDDVSLALRTLARQAQMNVVVSPAVTGPITLRMEGKTPREVIEIICDANGLVMDERNGVFHIKTQAEKAKEPALSFQYTFSYANAEKVAPLLKSQLNSGLEPQFDARTNTIFYREAKSNADKIQEFLVSIDRPTQQVMIEARLVEVNANPKQSYGINWGGLVGNSTTPLQLTLGGSNPAEKSVVSQTTGAGRIVDSSNTVKDTPNTVFGRPGSLLRDASSFSNLGRAALGQFAILSIPQLSATLRLLNEDTDAEFLANPRIVAANNQKAVIKITRAQPVPQLNFNEQTAQAVFSGFQDKEFGNSLTVTPSINKDNFVTLAVQPEISNKVGDATFTFSGATVFSPIIDKRTFDSNVLIKSGDTLAIGGLLQDEVSKGRSKVPVLGDIPILGYAFQERVNQRTKRNLLVFVTPTIVQSGYGTGLEGQVSGLTHSGEEYADPNGWRNNAKGAVRLVPTSNRQVAADIPKPGVPPVPKVVGKPRYKTTATDRQ
jgi:type IV pilus assembly protein PilQ